MIIHNGHVLQLEFLMQCKELVTSVSIMRHDTATFCHCRLVISSDPITFVRNVIIIAGLYYLSTYLSTSVIYFPIKAKKKKPVSHVELLTPHHHTNANFKPLPILLLTFS
jgi:hypothetical protein